MFEPMVGAVVGMLNGIVDIVGGLLAGALVLTVIETIVERAVGSEVGVLYDMMLMATADPVFDNLSDVRVGTMVESAVDVLLETAVDMLINKLIGAVIGTAEEAANLCVTVVDVMVGVVDIVYDSVIVHVMHTCEFIGVTWFFGDLGVREVLFILVVCTRPSLITQKVVVIKLQSIQLGLP